MDGGAVGSASTTLVTTLVNACLVLVERSRKVGPTGASVTSAGGASVTVADDSTEADAEAETDDSALAETEAEPLLAETEAD